MTKDAPAQLRALEEAFRSRKDSSPWYYATSMLALGFERLQAGSAYRWHGLRRGEDPKHPRITLQVTLEGFGNFRKGGREVEVRPGNAFLVLLPSAHEYYLPDYSPGWTFYWYAFTHPLLSQRLGAVAKTTPIIAMPPESRFAAESVSFFTRTCRGLLEDPWAEEAAILEWMLCLERHLHDLAHPKGVRQVWLDELRAFTLANLKRSFGVDEMADRKGLTRTHYSHQFLKATGWTPAAFVLEVRIQEARRQLREGRLSVSEIGALTGFADANHFCKVFRRLNSMSPGVYRKRMTQRT